MKKSLLILMMALFSAGVLSAQGTVGIFGFCGGAATNGNTSIFLGQAFADQMVASDGSEVATGVAQAQLNKLEPVEVTLTPDQDYVHPLYGTLKAPVTPGSYNGYLVHYIPYGYDRVKEYIIKILECPETVEDCDGNTYEVVGVGGYCWTKSNLKAENYCNPDGTPGAAIPTALIYNAAPNDDETANLENYGRLYTWYSAVGVAENDNTTEPTKVDGYVQGICPNGWHIPTPEQMNNLTAHPTKVLNTTEFWLTPNDYNNETGFSAHGAGVATIVGGNPYYSNLLGWTEFWSDTKATSDHGEPVATTLELSYFCATPKVHNKFLREQGLSVRCVKTNL